MKMEVLAVQQQYQSKYNIYGSSKVRDWTSTLSPLLPLSSCACIDTEPEVAASTPQPTASIPIPYLQNQQNYHHISSSSNNNNNMNIENNNNNNIINNYNNTVNNKNVKNSIMHHHHHHNHNHNHHHNNKKTKRTASTEELLAVPEVMIAPPSSKEFKKSQATRTTSAPTPTPTPTAAAATTTTTVGGSYLTTQHTPSPHPSANLFNCDDIDAAAMDDLSLRLLDELRAAKQRHLTCTEVSLPCDLTLRIAAEIIRVSEKEPCGIRGCTIYIEFEDEPNNSRRIAELKLDPEMVSTFEIYLTLRQDHRGWTSLLPQFMKSLARTITISPTFTITKHKLYSPSDRTSYSYNSSSSSSSSSASETISAQTS